MNAPVDFQGLFADVTGRNMRPDDAAELRRLLSRAPAGLQHSPSFLYSLIIEYHHAQTLRDTISNASSLILDDVHARSQHAVSRLVEDAVKKIQKTGPAVDRAYLRAGVAFGGGAGLLSLLALVALVGAQTMGWMVPPWLASEAEAKVIFAERIEAKIGRPRIDWLAERVDPRLVEIIDRVEARRSDQDPSVQLQRFQRCEGVGMVRSVSRGKMTCRFEFAR